MKILIIGQAHSIQKQEYLYDTTMLYTWLEECNISKIDAQKQFYFDAISNEIPKVNENGHIPPSDAAAERHWPDLLKVIDKVDKIIVLGKVAESYLKTKETFLNSKQVLYMIHPSKRNWALYQKNRLSIISKLDQFINNGR